ncbi:hypothetical protein [Mycolicibacterium vulneris]|nr:hypothetical protein [Mycolicibacterium vulneris]
MPEKLPIIAWDQAYNRNGDPALPRAVVNAIRTHMDNRSLTGWIKQETLAEYTGLSVRQVRRHIAANVEAGWLEVTSLGNSSGLASSYRLTFPKADTDALLKADIRDQKADMDVLPTTPVTTPGNYSRTSPEKADIDVRIPDPFGGSDIYLPANTTSEFKADMDVRIAKKDTGVRFGARDVRIAPDTPEQRLLNAIRAEGGSVPAKCLVVADAVGQDANVIIPQMIRDGLIIHDVSTEPARLALAHN